MIENNLSHKSGANSTLYKVAMNFFTLFSLITLMNSGHIFLFHKGFCTVYFKADKRNAVTLPHSAQRKHAFKRKIKNISKKNKLPAGK